MKIYFCDGCNESVPLAEVQSGHITTIAGKLFCKTCIPPSALQPTVQAPAPAASRGSHPLLVVVVLALLGWTAWREAEPYLSQPEEPLEPAGPTVEETLRQDLDELGDELRLLELGGEQRARELGQLAASLDGERAGRESLDKRLTGQEAEVLRLSRGQAAASSLIEKVQRNTNKVASLEVRMDALSDAVAAHQDLLEFGGGVPALSADLGGDMIGVGGGAPAEPAVDPARVAALEEIRRLLLDPEPDVRFDGVDQAEQGGFTELAPDLVALLEDEDMFVRLHAMNVLGNFGHEDAVPALLEVLEDGNASIRRTAAETLVRLTGYDPGFDHKGSSGERSRAIRKWRDWWEERQAP